MAFKSLCVVQMLPELESGGVERGTLELGQFLARGGHRSIVVSGGGRLVSQLEKDGSRHVTMPVGEKNHRSLLCVLGLRRLLCHERPDILHLRSRVPAWIGLMALATLPKEARPKVITTFHGFYSINPYSAVMTKGERVIAVSKTISEHIQQHYDVPDHRIRVIYRGCDTNHFDPDGVAPQRRERLKEKWGVSETGPPVILMPARITRLKGHDHFVRSLIRIQHLPWLALCVGDIDGRSSYTGELRSLIQRSNMDQRIRMVGHCDDIPAAIMLSDVVVSASNKPESFGRIAIEAQAMKRPVIATAHGGSLETVWDQVSGWLVPPGDEKALADALCQAISDPETRIAYGKNGYEWVRNKFTVENMCRETVAVYNELLDQAHA